MRKIFGTSLGLFGLAMMSSAHPVINELLFNPSGTDDGKEALEIQWNPNTSLNGYWFVVVEGDSHFVTGIVDQAVDLSTYSTGANGLCLIRDGAGDYTPFPDFQTNRYVYNFTPDIENGTNTYMIVQGTPPSVGTDLDVDNDGMIDAGALGGATVVDAVGWTDYTNTLTRDNYDFNNYAAEFGGKDLQTIFNPSSPWNPSFIGQIMRCVDSSGNTTDWLEGTQQTAHALSTDIDWSLTFSNTWATWPFNDAHMTFGNQQPVVAFSPTISGRFIQSDWDNDANPVTPLPMRRVQFEIRDSVGTPIKFQTCVLGKNGEYKLWVPNGPGIYQLSCKPDVPGTGIGAFPPPSWAGTPAAWIFPDRPDARSTWLRKTVTADCTAGSVSFFDIFYTNGDVNNDNVVDLGDFDQYAGAFGTSFGDSGFDANADLNGDQVVDLGDFDILSAAFGMEGDV